MWENFKKGDLIITERFKTIIYHGTEVTVSSYGRIFIKDKELPLRENRDGYYVVSMRVDEGHRSVRVNRLVAIAFIEQPHSDANEVNHIDFNRKNNHVDNLEWVTHHENVLYSRKAGRYPSMIGENNSNYGNRKLSKKYKENPELAKEKQSRPGIQNGRCCSVDLYYKGELIESFPYYKLCCEYLMNKLNLKSTSYISSVFDKFSKTGEEYKGYSVVKH